MLIRGDTGWCDRAPWRVCDVAATFCPPWPGVEAADRWGEVEWARPQGHLAARLTPAQHAAAALAPHPTPRL
eukprot:15483849-Alexandrium_andersonii.AAC.1